MENIMTQKCDKCQSDTKEGSIVAQQGKAYSLCRLCSLVVKNKSVEAFMNGFGHSDETKAMIEARKRRASGIRLWT